MFVLLVFSFLVGFAPYMEVFATDKCREALLGKAQSAPENGGPKSGPLYLADLNPQQIKDLKPEEIPNLKFGYSPNAEAYPSSRQILDFDYWWDYLLTDHLTDQQWKEREEFLTDMMFKPDPITGETGPYRVYLADLSLPDIKIMTGEVVKHLHLGLSPNTGVYPSFRQLQALHQWRRNLLTDQQWKEWNRQKFLADLSLPEIEKLQPSDVPHLHFGNSPNTRRDPSRTQIQALRGELKGHITKQQLETVSLTGVDFLYLGLSENNWHRLTREVRLYLERRHDEVERKMGGQI